MASEQVRKVNVRDDVESGERVHVERDGVPKMAACFESLGSGMAEKESGESGYTGRAEEERELEKQSKTGEERGEGEVGKGSTNEEISSYRQQAQQGSIDTLRAAEERYNQAKTTAASTLQKAKELVLGKGAHETQESRQAGGGLTDTPIEKCAQAKDTLAEKADKTGQYMAERGSVVKDISLEKGSQFKDTLAEGAQKTSQYVTEKGSAAKDIALEKGAQAKNTVAEGAHRSAQYVAEKGGSVKDTIVDKGQVAKEQTTTVAGKAKDVVVSTAVEVKDRAAVAGWAAAEYATGLTVEGTKKAVDITKGVAGYAGDTVGVVKDKVVGAEESMRDYMSRKREEAKRELEAKKMGHQREEMGEHETGEERNMAEAAVQKPEEAVGKLFFEGGEEQRDKGQAGGDGSGVLQAISETIVEIAHTTKDLVIGEDGQKGTGERIQQGEHRKQ